MDSESIRIARQLPLFSSLRDDQISCISAGEIIHLEKGELLVSEGGAPEYFFVNIEGEIPLHRFYDKQEILMGVNRPGMFMGEIPLLLEIPWLASAKAATPARLFRMAKDDFWCMLSTCHTITREILRAAAVRLRNMEGYSHQREKLASLGTMAAGLAHELNNPAAAARRATSHLQQNVDQVQGFICNLSKSLTPDHWQHLLNAAQGAIELSSKAPALSSVTRSDREEEIASWLERYGISESWRFAPALVSAGLDADWIKLFIEKIPMKSRNDAVGWLEARLTLKSLLGEIEQSTSRIADLIKAVKSYSYMDQSPMQEIDIHDGIESTLTILGHKLKGIAVEREFATDLPRIMAYGSELNQVWTNLIDNAIDAVCGSGRITISTRLDVSHIVVEIIDNGGGIPPEVQPHIFEPFFTTKGVGSGTGLGLVISHRIVADRHGGEIEFESQKGETRFRVRLPANGREAAVLSTNNHSVRRFTGLR